MTVNRPSSFSYARIFKKWKKPPRRILAGSLLETTSDKIHMLIFFKEHLSGQKLGIEMLLCHFPKQKKEK